MRISKSIFAAIVGVVASLGIGARGSEAATFFHYTSGAGSWVGGGATQTFDVTTGASITASRYFQQGAYTNAVYFNITQGSDWWSLYFVGPDLTLPVTGNYPNAQRWPFEASGYAGLSFDGDGRGDNTLTGSFNVLDAQFDANGNVTSFAADFTQYDEGFTSWWNQGSIRYNSAIPLPEAGTMAAGAAMVLSVGWRRRRA